VRRIAVLVVVAAGLLVTLAVSGTEVLPALSTDNDRPTKTVRTSTPTPTPQPSSTPTTAPDPIPTAAVTDAVQPGTVLTARPQPRRCPNPPCIPVG